MSTEQKTEAPPTGKVTAYDLRNAGLCRDAISGRIIEGVNWQSAADLVNERIKNLADASDANWEAACRATERAEAAKRELTALKAQWDAVGKGLPAEEK